MIKHTRRELLTLAMPVTIGATVGLTSTSALGNSTSSLSEKKMKIVVVKAHPGDPETICGGLIKNTRLVLHM